MGHFNTIKRDFLAPSPYLCGMWITGLRYQIGNKRLQQLAPQSIKGKRVWRNAVQRRLWWTAYDLGLDTNQPSKWSRTGKLRIRYF
jgi:hypothetical protein